MWLRINRMRPSSGSGGSHLGNPGLEKEGAKVPEFRMKVAPDTVAYADRENHKLAWMPMPKKKPNKTSHTHKYE